MIYPVRYYGDPVLRKVASPVTTFNKDLAELAQSMLETMYHYNGAGLAAPQIGLSKRLFVAAEFGATDEEAEDDTDLDGLSAEEKRQHWGVIAEHIMVNPLIEAQRGVQYGQDGCLSIPGLFVEEMRRDERIRVTYQDVCGKPQQLETEGRFAHVIQHEIDHLDGLLFIDRLADSEKRDFMEAHRTELADMQREAKAFLKSYTPLPVLSGIK